MPTVPNMSDVPQDPREPAVIVRHPRCPPAELMDPNDYYTLPRPLSTDPIHVRAMRGELDKDACAGCGEPMRLHYDSTGIYLIGCEGAMKRHSLGLLETRPLRQYGGDAHPTVSRRLQWALEVDCGPAMASLMEALSHDDKQQLARVLAEHAVAAHLCEELSK